jgi:hypothetical protein
VRGLAHGVQAKGGGAIDGLVDIGGGAVILICSQFERRRAERSQLGRLAHLIDRAAGGAAAEQNRGRALDHLDGLGVEVVAIVDGRIANAVEEEIIERGKAADIDGVAARRALARVEGDARNVLQGVFQSCGALGLHQPGGHDIDRLRSVLQSQRQLVAEQRSQARDDDLADIGRIVGLVLVGSTLSHRCGAGRRDRRAEAKAADGRATKGGPR